MVGTSYHYLYVSKNGTTQNTYNSTTNYSNRSIVVSAGDYVEFRYANNGSSVGSNYYAEISNISFTPASTNNVINGPTSTYFTTTNDTSYPWNTTATSISYCGLYGGAYTTYRFTFSAAGTFYYSVKTYGGSSNYLYVKKNDSTDYTYSSTMSAPYRSLTVSNGDYVEFRYQNTSSSSSNHYVDITDISFTPSNSSSSTPTSTYFTTTNDSLRAWDTTSTSLYYSGLQSSYSTTYRFTFSAAGTFYYDIDLVGTSSHYLYIRKNGSTYTSYNSSNSYSNRSLTIAAGDVIEFKYTNNSSSSSYSYSVEITDISFTPSNSGSSSSSTGYTTTNDTAYPWTVTSTSITSTNKSHSSTSKYRFTFTTSGTFYFDESASTESGWDYLYVYKNDTKQTTYTISGTQSKTGCSIIVSSGDRIDFSYEKDGSGIGGNDTVTISNFYFVAN